MIDFTSALYLGLRHPSEALRPWRRLTTGVPAALREPGSAEPIARGLAALTHCERAVLGTSTLHVFWDLFHGLADERCIIYMDAGLYPIARWGIERAAAFGVPVREVPHHDASALRRLLQESPRRRPVMVTDGFCPRCGRPAPLGAYLELTERAGGRLVVDDTQALGVLGRDPGPRAPYGRGGGGSLPWSRIASPDVIVVASLAKGLGVPLAVLAGSATAVSRFEATSETRVHCSPPSVAALRAAEHALAVNRRHGDALRARLVALVSAFRRELSRAGFPVVGGRFPVQTLGTIRGDAAVRLHGALRRRGILTVLRRDVEGVGGPRLTCLLTARHTAGDVAALARALASGNPARALALSMAEP
ncbi:MAG TPA: aminotransferase class I/II-fold pyridoxal phosphate-dependent enzyme [Methylomirabilota bacterium]|jgi:8-amino-7-oxononanoate synthase